MLCEADRPLVYMEDVGRHNAVDKIAGYMLLKGIGPESKIFYTTGRLTSEMVIKTVQMRIPILISRSGFTAWGVELARKADLTLIGRAKGKRFVALAGEHRIVFDADPQRRRRGGARATSRKPAASRTTRRERPGITPILGVLLAGGQSRRMGGGDKCLRDARRPDRSSARVIDAHGPQVARARAQRQRRSRRASPSTACRSRPT